jgi:hypothetical protein
MRWVDDTSFAWVVVVGALGSKEPEYGTKRTEVRLCATNRSETGMNSLRVRLQRG